MGSCQITKNQIKLELNKIIQICLKIYDLWKHVGIWVDRWVDGLDHVKSLKAK